MLFFILLGLASKIPLECFAIMRLGLHTSVYQALSSLLSYPSRQLVLATYPCSRLKTFFFPLVASLTSQQQVSIQCLSQNGSCGFGWRKLIIIILNSMCLFLAVCVLSSAFFLVCFYNSQSSWSREALVPASCFPRALSMSSSTLLSWVAWFLALQRSSF